MSADLETMPSSARLARMRRIAWTVLVLLAVSVAAVLLTTYADSESVTSKSDQADVGLGMPFVWLHQDQTSLDPPFPWTTSVQSPLEHPTDTSTGYFLADTSVFFAPAALVVAYFVRVRAKRR